MNIAIILAAGKSTRLNAKEKKQFIMYKNEPLFLHSLNTFYAMDCIDKVVLVIDEHDKDHEAIKKYLSIKINVTYGGVNRYDSVHNALDYIRRNFDMEDDDHILIHDSARPFITKDDIKKLNDALSVHDVVSLATRTTDTIKYVEKEENIDGKIFAKVERTIDRQKLWNMLTPQGFKYKAIKDAYDKFFSMGSSQNITDDLQIIENFSDSSAYLIEGSKYNVKITTNEDLKYLE